jgi:hypothetical protein
MAEMASHRRSILESSGDLPKGGNMDLLDWGMPPRQQCGWQPTFFIYSILSIETIPPAIGDQWDWGIPPSQSGKNLRALQYCS